MTEEPADPLLEAVQAFEDAYDLSDAELERQVGLPQAFLSKWRAGGRRGAGAQESLTKLRRFLERATGVEPGSTEEPSDSRPSSARDELAEQIENASTQEALEAAQRRVVACMARRELDRHEGAALVDACRKQGLALERASEEAARIRSDEPVEIVVTFKQDWRGLPCCTRCGGTGREPVEAKRA